MPANYNTPDYIQGQIDLDEKFITDAWLVDQFVGGALFTWGHDGFGELGNGVGNGTINYSSPLLIGTLTNWSQVSSGDNGITGAIKTDGTLWTCGYNGTAGALGIDSSGVGSYSTNLGQVGLLTNWKTISCGAASCFMVALKTDGTIWSWGDNSSGQLGNSTTTNYSSPIQIGSLASWKQISTRGTCTAAIKTDGTLWSWGGNTNGQLGNNTRINYSSPVQIGALTNWKIISAGSYATAAIKTDGTLWVWGQNSYGGLGNGTTVNYSSPVQIGSLNNWYSVSIGKNHSAAIKTDGTLWSWGNNNYGQLGNGTTVNYSSPVQVGALTNWKQVSCGYNTAVIKTDGTLWTFGYNNFGQLGNNTRNIYYSSPVQVGSLTNWKQIQTCINHTIAVSFKDLG